MLITLFFFLVFVLVKLGSFVTLGSYKKERRMFLSYRGIEFFMLRDFVRLGSVRNNRVFLGSVFCLGL